MRDLHADYPRTMAAALLRTVQGFSRAKQADHLNEIFLSCTRVKATHDSLSKAIIDVRCAAHPQQGHAISTIFSSLSGATTSGNQAGTHITQTMCSDLDGPQNDQLLRHHLENLCTRTGELERLKKRPELPAPSQRDAPKKQGQGRGKSKSKKLLMHPV